MKQKIKICFVLPDAYQTFNQNIRGHYGGAEIQLYLISKELAKNKEFEVSFVVGDYGQPNEEIKDNVKLYKIKDPRHQKFLALFGPLRYFKLLKKINANIYFTTTFGYLPGFVSIFCKLNKKKQIHRTAHLNDVNGERIKSSGFFRGFFYKYGLKNSDLIITQTEEHKSLLKKVHNLKSIVIKNSFEINPKKDFKKEWILWVGSFKDWKHPELFLNLAKENPTEKFVMICPSFNISKEYLSFIKKINKLKNLTFKKKVPFDKIQEYFNRAKIFINTSDFEGFPNTFIQAGIGATPILSLNVNPDNFIDKYKCGYCANGNVELLKKYLKKLNNNKERLEKGKNSYFYVCKEHNIDRNIDKIKFHLNCLK